MGEYAEALYRKNPRLREVDPGDVSKEIEVSSREREREREREKKKNYLILLPIPRYVTPCSVRASSGSWRRWRPIC